MEMGVTAAAIVLIVGLFVCLGLKRTKVANRILVAVVIIAFIAYGITCLSNGPIHYEVITQMKAPGFKEVMYGAALLFVSFTGYGRVATLGEEVVNPKRTIPLAVVASLAVAFGIYFWIALSSINVVGESGYGELALKTYAPLQAITRLMGHDWL